MTGILIFYRDVMEYLEIWEHKQKEVVTFFLLHVILVIK